MVTWLHHTRNVFAVACIPCERIRQITIVRSFRECGMKESWMNGRNVRTCCIIKSAHTHLNWNFFTSADSERSTDSCIFNEKENWYAKYLLAQTYFLNSAHHWCCYMRRLMEWICRHLRPIHANLSCPNSDVPRALYRISVFSTTQFTSDWSHRDSIFWISFKNSSRIIYFSWSSTHSAPELVRSSSFAANNIFMFEKEIENIRAEKCTLKLHDVRNPIGQSFIVRHVMCETIISFLRQNEIFARNLRAAKTKWKIAPYIWYHSFAPSPGHVMPAGEKNEISSFEIPSEGQKKASIQPATQQITNLNINNGFQRNYKSDRVCIELRFCAFNEINCEFFSLLSSTEYVKYCKYPQPTDRKFIV